MRSETRIVAALAWPSSLSMVAFMAMNVIDAISVGQLGAAAQAGVASSAAWGLSGAVVALGMVRALEPIVSQAHGEGDREAIGQALTRMLALSLPLSLATGLWWCSAGTALRWLDQPANTLPHAEAYAFAFAFSWPAALLIHVLRTFLQALGIVRPALVAMLFGTAVKWPLNAVLIHGAGPIPAMGVAGAAVSTCLVDVLILAILTWSVRGVLRDYWPADPGLSPRALLRLAGQGAVIGVQMGTEFWAFSSMAIMMGWLGEEAQAAHTVAINLASLTFMIPLGVSIAASARVGFLVGEGKDWGPAARAALGLGVATQIVAALTFLLAGPYLVRPYSSDPGVLAMATLLLPIAGAFQLFDGLQVIGFGILRGAGDVRLPTLANLAGYYLAGLPIGYLAGIHWGGGPTAIWWAITLGLGIVAGVLLVRIRQVHRRGGIRVR